MFQLRDIYEDRFNVFHIIFSIVILIIMIIYYQPQGCARITYARSADAERLLASKDQPDVK